LRAQAQATLLVLPCSWQHARRAWAIACVATLAPSLGLQALPALWPGERVIGDRWNQATRPGLVEGALFRGVLLALLDRAIAARRVVLGVLPAALAYLWLRLRTGSLVLPLVVHNLWNLSVYAVHLAP
jgi:hypothetical protein